MQVQGQDPYSTLLQPPRTTAADAVADAEASKNSSSESTAVTADKSTDAPPMNTTGTTLASDTLIYMINEQGEKVEAKPVEFYRIDYQSMLDDPELGARYLSGAGKSGMYSLTHMPLADGPSDDWAKFQAGYAARQTEFDRATGEREAIYDRMMEEGATPAEIYKEFVRQEIKQPDSYWAARDYGGDGNLRQKKIEELADIQKTEADIYLKSGSNIRRPEEVIARDHALALATDPTYADKWAYDMGHSVDLTVIPAEVFEKAVAEGESWKITNGYPLNDMGNPILKVQQQRADLYDYLKEKGATSLQIIEEIHKFNISLPLNYSDDFLDVSASHPAEGWRNQQKERLENLTDALDWAGIKHPSTEIENIPVPDETAMFADPPGSVVVDLAELVARAKLDSDTRQVTLSAMAEEIAEEQEEDPAAGEDREPTHG
jgi:hypothetical protein